MKGMLFWGKESSVFFVGNIEINGEMTQTCLMKYSRIAPSMKYLPTFTIKSNSMKANTPYMDGMDMECLAKPLNR